MCGAAARAIGSSTVRVTDSDVADIECTLESGGVRLNVVAQASPQAWTEYDTETTHLSQAFGPSSVHNSGELPRPVPSVARNAVWVPAQSELIATNGTQTTGGAYVTVTVKRTSSHGPGSLPVASAVARATLDAAPRGSNPGSTS